jgi:hypothetical protein
MNINIRFGEEPSKKQTTKATMKKIALKTTPTPSLNIESINFQYEVEYDCSTHNLGGEGYHAGDEGIDSININSVNIDKVIKIICENLSGFNTGEGTINRYCVDRLCRIHKLYSREAFEGEVRGGYYGDEVESIHINHSIASELYLALMGAFVLNSLKEKTLYLLEKEYGFILPEITQANNFSLESFSLKSDCKFSFQENYMRKIDAEVISHYKDYDGIICILLKKDRGYRIIDGYHRWVAHNKYRKDYLMKAIVIS